MKHTNVCFILMLALASMGASAWGAPSSADALQYCKQGEKPCVQPPKPAACKKYHAPAKPASPTKVEVRGAVEITNLKDLDLGGRKLTTEEIHEVVQYFREHPSMIPTTGTNLTQADVDRLIAQYLQEHPVVPAAASPASPSVMMVEPKCKKQDRHGTCKKWTKTDWNAIAKQFPVTSFADVQWARMADAQEGIQKSVHHLVIIGAIDTVLNAVSAGALLKIAIDGPASMAQSQSQIAMSAAAGGTKQAVTLATAVRAGFVHPQ